MGKANYIPPRTGIETLPNEVLVKIFSYLGARSLVRLAPVSHRFHELSCDNSLWRQVKGVRELQLRTPRPYGSFKKLYMALREHLFLAPHLWFSTRRFTGEIMVFRYVQETGYIEGYPVIALLSAERNDSDPINARRTRYSLDPSVVVYHFRQPRITVLDSDPRVRIRCTPETGFDEDSGELIYLNTKETWRTAGHGVTSVSRVPLHKGRKREGADSIYSAFTTTASGGIISDDDSSSESDCDQYDTENSATSGQEDGCLWPPLIIPSKESLRMPLSRRDDWRAMYTLRFGDYEKSSKAKLREDVRALPCGSDDEDCNDDSDDIRTSKFSSQYFLKYKSVGRPLTNRLTTTALHSSNVIDRRARDFLVPNHGNHYHPIPIARIAQANAPSVTHGGVQAAYNLDAEGSRSNQLNGHGIDRNFMSANNNAFIVLPPSQICLPSPRPIFTGHQFLCQDVEAYAKLSPRLYQPKPLPTSDDGIDLSGLWLGDYPSHGPEFVLFYHPSENPRRLEVIKLTGDPAIPKGEHSFIVDDITGSTGDSLIRIAGPDETEWPGAKVVKAKGHTAYNGFVQPSWEQGEFIILNNGNTKRRRSKGRGSGLTGRNVSSIETGDLETMVTESKQDLEENEDQEEYQEGEVCMYWKELKYISRFRKIDVERLLYGESISGKRRPRKTVGDGIQYWESNRGREGEDVERRRKDVQWRG